MSKAEEKKTAEEMKEQEIRDLATIQRVEFSRKLAELREKKNPKNYQVLTVKESEELRSKSEDWQVVNIFRVDGEKKHELIFVGEEKKETKK